MYIYNLVKKYSISKALFITYFTFLALIIYFSFRLFFGQKGIMTMLDLQGQIKNRDLVKKELINEIKNKKVKVDGMRSQSLDLDLLDEQARKKLNYSGKDELVIFDDNDKKQENDK